MMPEGIRKRYKGKIIDLVAEVTPDGIRLKRVVRKDAFVLGNYVGFRGKLWHVDKATPTYMWFNPSIFRGLELQLSEFSVS